jgi:hypothetical protein
MTKLTLEDIGNVGEMIPSYIETALWATTYNGNDPDIDSDEDSDLSFRTLGYDIENCSLEFLEKSKKDLLGFMEMIVNDSEASKELSEIYYEECGKDSASFAHDFFLSRNGHGAGFFDCNCNKLQKFAKTFRETNLYANETGMIF